MGEPDLYATLGVAPSATSAEIKRRYFARAQTEHSDRGGDLRSWQEVTNAYSTLVDEERRKAYDRKRAGLPPEVDAWMKTILRGEDLADEVTVPWLVALKGGRVEYRGRRVRVPPGTPDGTVLRLRGHGGPGYPPGDLLLQLLVSTHPQLRRGRGQQQQDGTPKEDELDLYMTLPLSELERYRGGPVEVPTPWGPFLLRFRGSDLDAGEEVLLRGYGVRCGCLQPCTCRRGDLRVRIAIVTPPANDAALLHVLDRLQGGLDPRARLKATMEEDNHGP